MSELDGAKEEIAYLKLWLGIMYCDRHQPDWVVTWQFPLRPLVAWWGGLAGLVSLGCGCFALRQQIKAKIDEIKRL